MKGDGGTPPVIATAMFTAACFLLILPALRQVITKQFFSRLGTFVSIVAVFIVLAFLLMLTVAVQGNSLFCFLMNGPLRALSGVGRGWQKLIAIYMMIMLVFVNFGCAHFLQRAFLTAWEYGKCYYYFRVKCFEKRRAKKCRTKRRERRRPPSVCEDECCPLSCCDDCCVPVPRKRTFCASDCDAVCDDGLCVPEVCCDPNGSCQSEICNRYACCKEKKKKKSKRPKRKNKSQKQSRKIVLGQNPKDIEFDVICHVKLETKKSRNCRVKVLKRDSKSR